MFRGVIVLSLGACFVWYRLYFFSPSSPLPAPSGRVCPLVQSLALIFGLSPFSSAPTAWRGLGRPRSAFRLRRMAVRRLPSPPVLIPGEAPGIAYYNKNMRFAFFFLDESRSVSTGLGAVGEGRSEAPALQKNRINRVVVERVNKRPFFCLNPQQ